MAAGVGLGIVAVASRPAVSTLLLLVDVYTDTPSQHIGQGALHRTRVGMKGAWELHGVELATFLGRRVLLQERPLPIRCGRHYVVRVDLAYPGEDWARVWLVDTFGYDLPVPWP
jgi:hypothetical protein